MSDPFIGFAYNIFTIFSLIFSPFVAIGDIFTNCIAATKYPQEEKLFLFIKHRAWLTKLSLSHNVFLGACMGIPNISNLNRNAVLCSTHDFIAMNSLDWAFNSHRVQEDFNVNRMPTLMV